MGRQLVVLCAEIRSDGSSCWIRRTVVGLEVVLAMVVADDGGIIVVDNVVRNEDEDGVGDGVAPPAAIFGRWATMGS